jgi:hypothetical protein
VRDGWVLRGSPKLACHHDRQVVEHPAGAAHGVSVLGVVQQLQVVSRKESDSSQGGGVDCGKLGMG